jgi:hypothetical protein
MPRYSCGLYSYYPNLFPRVVGAHQPVCPVHLHRSKKKVARRGPYWRTVDPIHGQLARHGFKDSLRAPEDKSDSMVRCKLLLVWFTLEAHGQTWQR